MSFIRRIDAIEIEFYSWITQSPKSFHPLDRERFYSFSKAILCRKKTDGRKWLKKDYFHLRCKNKNPNLPDKVIDKYWEIFEIIKDYEGSSRIYEKTKYYKNDDEYLTYRLQMIVDGKFEEVIIDKSTYEKKYISKKFFLELLKKKNSNIHLK